MGDALTAGRRVHRVANRIGLVFGGILLLLAIPLLSIGVFNYSVGRPQLATRFEDVYEYPKPKLFGDVVQYDDGSSVFLVDYLARDNAVRKARHLTSAKDSLTFGGAFVLASIALYLVCRALGWIIAGAFN